MKKKSGGTLLGLALLGGAAYIGYRAGREKGKAEMRIAADGLRLLDESIARKEAGLADTIITGTLPELRQQRADLLKGMGLAG